MTAEPNLSTSFRIATGFHYGLTKNKKPFLSEGQWMAVSY